MTEFETQLLALLTSQAALMERLVGVVEAIDKKYQQMLDEEQTINSTYKPVVEFRRYATGVR